MYTTRLCYIRRYILFPPNILCVSCEKHSLKKLSGKKNFCLLNIQLGRQLKQQAPSLTSKSVHNSLLFSFVLFLFSQGFVLAVPNTNKRLINSPFFPLLPFWFKKKVWHHLFCYPKTHSDTGFSRTHWLYLTVAPTIAVALYKFSKFNHVGKRSHGSHSRCPPSTCFIFNFSASVLLLSAAF